MGDGDGAGRRGPAAKAGLAGLVLALAILPLGVLALAGCAAGTKAGDPALPTGFADLGMPDVDVNALVYVNAGEPARVPLGVFDATDLVAGTGVLSIETSSNSTTGGPFGSERLRAYLKAL